MSDSCGDGALQALRQIPGGVFVITSRHENRRDAVLVRGAQICSDNPALVMVAVRTGHFIEPLVLNSRRFALCQVCEEDRSIARKFAHKSSGDDSLTSWSTKVTPGGAPVIDRALAYLDCKLVRHVELDCDYRIYVGEIDGGSMLREGSPAMRFGMIEQTQNHDE